MAHVGDAGARDVRLLSTARRGVQRFAVSHEGTVFAHVEVGRARPTLRTVGVSPAADREGSLPAAAWPTASADRAAAARWADHHVAVLTVARVDLAEGAGDRAREALEAVGLHLAEAGARRLDVRVPAADPVAGWLRGAGWMQGAVGASMVASHSLGYPWSHPKEPSGTASRRSGRLPQPVRRLGRRLATMRPAQVPELAQIAAAEVGAAVRLRYAPGPPRVHPVDGAPPGTFPFAVTRYRTIRTALDLVPPDLRSTRFVDIGCGDGRVLREAIDRGWSSVHGRELEAALGDRARAAIGGHGTVEVGDGLVAPLPDDTGVVYLNNPFQIDGLTRLAALLAGSLARRPRPLVVIYINPRGVGPLAAEGFALVQCTPAFSLLTFASG
ncbi:MAG: hypothetical protein JWO77_886 [Ilumatobacteraceae bacterium]|nr:hypothetical protein [Ilumatobacteraceae bacterium]